MGVTSNWCHPQGHHARRPPTTVPSVLCKPLLLIEISESAKVFGDGYIITPMLKHVWTSFTYDTNSMNVYLNNFFPSVINLDTPTIVKTCKVNITGCLYDIHFSKRYTMKIRFELSSTNILQWFHIYILPLQFCHGLPCWRPVADHGRLTGIAQQTAGWPLKPTLMSSSSAGWPKDTYSQKYSFQ